MERVFYSDFRRLTPATSLLQGGSPQIKVLVRIIGNQIAQNALLGKEKAKIKNRPQHASWLRIYAIKLEPGCDIITGGAIKLTRTMQEREHTLTELKKMESVRSVLLEGGAIDADGFIDFMSEIQ